MHTATYIIQEHIRFTKMVFILLGIKKALIIQFAT